MGTSPQGGLDQASLEQLFLRLEKPVYNVVYRWLWQPQDAREVVQEAFVRLWRMRDRVRMETVEPLLYRIALNLASKKRRSRRLWRWLSLDSAPERSVAAGGDAQRAVEERQRQAALRQAVEALPERLRSVVMLCEFSELSYAEVGQALGIPEGTVGSRRNAALKRLRQQLGQRSEREVL